MPDEPQIVRDMRRVGPRNAVPDDQGGNAAARRMWIGPEPLSDEELANLPRWLTTNAPDDRS